MKFMEQNYMAKFVKYFLLTAKTKNGNLWGISPETAEHNMKYFVNRPLICTDRSWFPNSAYDSYDHAYLPSNDLYAVLRHQEPYRVGTIREIQKTGDNYYAIAEILPKFASKSFPPFCSPAIFQVNPMEDEGHINQWIPLHLAILDTSPAYGAQIALLKGTCSGTPEACSIQLKTAKLLTAITEEELNPNDIMDVISVGPMDTKHVPLKHKMFDHITRPPTIGEYDLDEDKKTNSRKTIKVNKSQPFGIEGDFKKSSKIICPQKIANKLKDLRKESGIEEEPDNDADLERFMEQKDERFKRDIDRHVTRGGKQLSADEQPSVKINPEHGKQIADAYGSMKHDPNNPDVKKSYDALISETGKQYSDLIKGGLKIDKIKPGETPYKNSQDMHKDLSENNHLHYFPTEHGFGAGEENKDHPMMRETEFKHEDKPMLANDVFRIVHDINGHHKGGMSGFGPKGEHQAYLTHKKMYSPEAQGALASETMGQNNYVNFGPNGEHNRKDPGHTIYAPQKAGLMPDKIVNGNFHNAESKIGKLVEQKLAAINGNLLGPHQRLNPDVALKKEVPFGKENRTKTQIKSDTVKRIGEGFGAIGDDTKIRPDKPKQRDRTRIIQAKLEGLILVAGVGFKPFKEDKDYEKEKAEKGLDLHSLAEHTKKNLGVHPSIPLENYIVRTDETNPRGGNGFIHPPTPTQKDFQKIISAKLQKLAIVKSPDKFKVTDELKHIRVDSNGPLINKVPFGEEDRDTSEQFLDRKIRGINYERTKDNQIKPDKIKQKDRTRIIQAKIAALYDKSCPMNKKRVKNISAKLQLLAMTNLETDKDKILGRFNSSLNKYRKSVKGEHEAQSLNEEGFREVFRTDAVKHGNRYKKLTGQHPEGMEEVLKGTTRQASKEPDFDEARIRYNLNKAGGRIDHSKGFTYVPKDNKVYDANNKEDALALQKRFGNGKDAIHAIARTDNHSDKLDENHKFNGKTMREHYDDIVKEGKTPTIGGFDEGGDKTTDIATVEPLSDEEARKKIKEHGQRSSGKIGLDGKFEIFS